MKPIDSSVISENVEFIFNLLNVVVTKHFFVFSYEAVNFILNTLPPGEGISDNKPAGRGGSAALVDSSSARGKLA